MGVFVVKGSDSMTDKQSKFIDEYMISGNAADAARKAGYAERSARQIGQSLLTKHDISDEIQKRQEALHAEKVASAAEVMEYLTSVVRGQSSSHVLSMCGDGCQEVIKKPPDEKERLKAAELLGKRYGMFNDKISVNGSIPVVISGGEDLVD